MKGRKHVESVTNRVHTLSPMIWVFFIRFPVPDLFFRNSRMVFFLYGNGIIIKMIAGDLYESFSRTKRDCCLREHEKGNMILPSKRFQEKRYCHFMWSDECAILWQLPRISKNCRMFLVITIHDFMHDNYMA